MRLQHPTLSSPAIFRMRVIPAFSGISWQPYLRCENETKESVMNERRSLIDGLKQTPPAVDPKLEKDFVYQAKTLPNGEGTATNVATSMSSSSPTHSRAPISTRIRADLATALKRASLERQLSGTEPNTLQDILEEAIEPWLRSHGYLP